MVAPVRVAPVEDSFVRIAPKNNNQIIQADITQSLVDSENNIHSPINRQIEDLCANQIRQSRLTLNRFAEVPLLGHSLQAYNNQNETTANLLVKNVSTALNVKRQSLTNRIAANATQEFARERRELLRTLPVSQQRSTIVRMRSKISLRDRAQIRPATLEQQDQIIKKLESDVNNLQKDSNDLKRKVSLFQELFRDRQKLDKVLKMLDENKHM